MKFKIQDDMIVFGTGALGYGLIEVLWRGSTHPTMLLAGGVCLLSLGEVNRRMAGQPLLYRCVAGGSLITGVELAIGAVCNLGLGMNIWDYSGIPLNFRGQICLLFSVAWALLSIAAMLLEGAMRRALAAGHGIRLEIRRVVSSLQNAVIEK